MKLFKSIMFCTDFSEGADRAFDVALELAKTNGARLFLMHVIPPIVSPSPAFEEFVPNYSSIEFTEQVMNSSQEKMAETYGARLDGYTNYEVRVENGYPSNRIVDFAEQNDVDLIVVGSQGLTGLAHVFFGSTAEKVVRKAPCTVMCVRHRSKE
ncbi:MAG: universal stress protein [Deltaproteobacteria bacterium]|nr:universal stress protein [Deltaproteobacteria bacterium]